MMLDKANLRVISNFSKVIGKFIGNVLLAVHLNGSIFSPPIAASFALSFAQFFQNHAFTLFSQNWHCKPLF